MRKKVRIIHPFTKRKQTGSSLLKKQKLEIALNVLGSRLESLGKCCQKLPGSSTDLQGTELSLGPGVRKDSQVNPCLFSCEMIERMCWPILSLWLSLKKVWYVWYDAFLQFYRSFYPKENTYKSLHILSQNSAFSASAPHSKWSGSRHLGCEPPLLQFMAAIPRLSLFHCRGWPWCAKEVMQWQRRLLDSRRFFQSVSIVSPCFPPLKQDIRQKTSWNFRQCLATRCFALSHPFAPFLLVSAAPIPSDTCDMTRAPFATWRGTKYIYQDVACLRTVTFH